MSQRSRFRMIGVGLLVLSLGALGRAAPAPGSPEAALAQAVEAMNQDRLEDYTALMLPDALKQFRTTMTSLIDITDKQGKAAGVLPIFGAESIAEIKALDDRAFFVRFLRGVAGKNPEIKKALAGAKTEMLGHVPEGKDRAHVVYTLTIEADGKPIANTTVNSLQKHGSQWALLLSGDMEGMVEMMKLQASGKPVLPNVQSSRVEPVGRLIPEGDAAPAYVVYRLVTPIGESHLSKIAVLTVHKSDPGWAIAHRGKHEELAQLVRKELGLDGSPGAEPESSTPSQETKPRAPKAAPRPRPGAGTP
jgi:hypothetical protein